MKDLPRFDIHTRSVCEWQERNYETWQNETLEVTVMMISTKKRGEISKENVDLEVPLHLDSYDVAVVAHRRRRRKKRSEFVSSWKLE
tara:strand:+ start:329 stop:589 length:261 start_codon:yes stop_codon:yes gene_type:complete